LAIVYGIEKYFKGGDRFKQTPQEFSLRLSMEKRSENSNDSGVSQPKRLLK